MRRCLSTKTVNFGVMEYYHDDSFARLAEHFYALLGESDAAELPVKTIENILQSFAAIIDVTRIKFFDSPDRVIGLAAFVSAVLRNRADESAERICTFAWKVITPLLALASTDEQYRAVFVNCRPMLGIVLRRIGSTGADELSFIIGVLLYQYAYDQDFVFETLTKVVQAFAERFRPPIFQAFSELFDGVAPPISDELIKGFKLRVHQFNAVMRRYAAGFPAL